MKKLCFICAALTLSFAVQAQVETNDTRDTNPDNSTGRQPQYTDIRTGQPLEYRFDSASHSILDPRSGKPIDFFVNSATGDTLTGSGYIVNNYLTREDSVYTLDKQKVETRGDKLWELNGNKELMRDKNWEKNYGNHKNKGRSDKKETI